MASTLHTYKFCYNYTIEFHFVVLPLLCKYIMYHYSFYNTIIDDSLSYPESLFSASLKKAVTKQQTKIIH